MVLASPLQMAMRQVAASANGGTCYYPRLIDKVVTQRRRRCFCRKPPRCAPISSPRAASPREQIEKVRLGMNKVVNEGGGNGRQGRASRTSTVAGKTGTAQFWRNGMKDNHTRFIAVRAHDETPKYAVCVIVQGAKSGGGVSAPIAAKILEDSFALDKRAAPKARRRSPYEIALARSCQGQFHLRRQASDFNREILAATTIAADEETGGADAAQCQPGKSPAGQARTCGMTPTRAAASKIRSASLLRIEKFFNIFKGGGERKEKEEANLLPGRR